MAFFDKKNMVQYVSSNILPIEGGYLFKYLIKNMSWFLTNIYGSTNFPISLKISDPFSIQMVLNRLEPMIIRRSNAYRTQRVWVEFSFLGTLKKYLTYLGKSRQKCCYKKPLFTILCKFPDFCCRKSVYFD